MRKVIPFPVIDTREQLPYEFPEWPCIRKALPSGDYSLVGLENTFAVERKSQTDLLGCWHTDRFKAELKRLSAFDKAFLVIESDLYRLRNDKFYKGNINAVLGFLQSVPLLYGVHVLFLGDREGANRFVAGLLEKYTRYFLTDKREEV